MTFKNAIGNQQGSELVIIIIFRQFSPRLGTYLSFFVILNFFLLSVTIVIALYFILYFFSLFQSNFLLANLISILKYELDEQSMNFCFM